MSKKQVVRTWKTVTDKMQTSAKPMIRMKLLQLPDWLQMVLKNELMSLQFKGFSQ